MFHTILQIFMFAIEWRHFMKVVLSEYFFKVKYSEFSWKQWEMAQKCQLRPLDFDSFQRMEALRKSYFATFTFIFSVKISNSH